MLGRAPKNSSEWIVEVSRKQRKEDKQTRLAEGDDSALREKRSFHRGETVNYHPRRADFDAPNFLEQYLLKGWIPSRPILTKGMKITAFGSCFAANITRHLTSIGFNLSSSRDPDVYISRLGDGMVNTASILGQFQWALEDKKQAVDLWHGYKAEGYGYDEDIRRRTRDIFLGTEFFIITLGLSEIWYDEETGGTFWRAVPEEAFDPARHKFRVMSFAETKAHIEEIRRLIRRHVPEAKILFTVSPIPLAATFRPVSCLSANLVSKSILRAALDEFLREHEDELNSNLFYFPSMELVQLGFTDAWKDDSRHPIDPVLDTVMKTFEAAFCVSDTSLADAQATYHMFRVQNMQDVLDRLSGSEEEKQLVQAARAAARANRLARRKAKDGDVRLADAADEESKESKRARKAEQRAEKRAAAKAPIADGLSWKERRAEKLRRREAEANGEAEPRKEKTSQRAGKADAAALKKASKKAAKANGEASKSKDERRAEKTAQKASKKAGQAERKAVKRAAKAEQKKAAE